METFTNAVRGAAGVWVTFCQYSGKSHSPLFQKERENLLHGNVTLHSALIGLKRFHGILISGIVFKIHRAQRIGNEGGWGWEIRLRWVGRRVAGNAEKKGLGERRDLRENAPTSGIVRHDSHLRITGNGPDRGLNPDKIDVKHVYTEVDFAIGLQFIRHALDDSEPIADLQGNKELGKKKRRRRRERGDGRHLHETQLKKSTARDPVWGKDEAFRPHGETMPNSLRGDSLQTDAAKRTISSNRSPHTLRRAGKIHTHAHLQRARPVPNKTLSTSCHVAGRRCANLRKGLGGGVRPPPPPHPPTKAVDGSELCKLQAFVYRENCARRRECNRMFAINKALLKALSEIYSYTHCVYFRHMWGNGRLASQPRLSGFNPLPGHSGSSHVGNRGRTMPLVSAGFLGDIPNASIQCVKAHFAAAPDCPDAGSVPECSGSRQTRGGWASTPAQATQHRKWRRAHIYTHTHTHTRKGTKHTSARVLILCGEGRGRGVEKPSRDDVLYKGSSPRPEITRLHLIPSANPRWGAAMMVGGFKGVEGVSYSGQSSSERRRFSSSSLNPKPSPAKPTSRVTPVQSAVLFVLFLRPFKRVRTSCWRRANFLRLLGRKIMQGDMHRDKEGLGSHGLHFGAMTTSLSVLRAGLNYEEQGENRQERRKNPCDRERPASVVIACDKAYLRPYAVCARSFASKEPIPTHSATSARNFAIWGGGERENFLPIKGGSLTKCSIGPHDAANLYLSAEAALESPAAQGQDWPCFNCDSVYFEAGKTNRAAVAERLDCSRPITTSPGSIPRPGVNRAEQYPLISEFPRDSFPPPPFADHRLSRPRCYKPPEELSLLRHIKGIAKPFHFFIRRQRLFTINTIQFIVFISVAVNEFRIVFTTLTVGEKKCSCEIKVKTSYDVTRSLPNGLQPSKKKGLLFLSYRKEEWPEAAYPPLLPPLALWAVECASGILSRRLFIRCQPASQPPRCIGLEIKVTKIKFLNALTIYFGAKKERALACRESFDNSESDALQRKYCYGALNVRTKNLVRLVLGTRPFVLREYVYVDALGRLECSNCVEEYLKHSHFFPTALLNVPPMYWEAAVTEQLDSSSPTEAELGSIPIGFTTDFRKWESFRAMPLAANHGLSVSELPSSDWASQVRNCLPGKDTWPITKGKLRVRHRTLESSFRINIFTKNKWPKA
ncbi:hypothetical protein PR048_033570 [Dryococelus australis]|uniref:Uncharacterized protein n=1 Tax=Dryococelus australis TaxID=614101 RepID=A0ABQ9G0N9_9NEOP|nr:hypothetical protein PR048_033570 [Dryococelus australis]